MLYLAEKGLYHPSCGMMPYLDGVGSRWVDSWLVGEFWYLRMLYELLGIRAFDRLGLAIDHLVLWEGTVNRLEQAINRFFP